MIKFGIISTARANKNSLLFPSKKRSDLLVHAIASRSLKKARLYAKDQQIPKFYGSYEQLLEDKDIDVVYISLPNAMHKEYVEKALQKNKHVLCEKPLVSSWKDGAFLKELAEKHQLLLFDALHYLYYPVTQKIIQMLQQNALGKIQKLEIYLDYPFPPLGDIRLQPKMHGGAFMHMGCYCLHFAHEVLNGQKLSVIDVKVEKYKNMADILTIATLKSNDAMVKIECNFKGHDISSTIKIWGEKGFLQLNNPLNPTIVFGDNLTVSQTVQVMSIQSQVLDIDFPDYKKTTYDFQLDFFMQTLKNKNLKPVVYLEVYKLIEEICLYCV